MRTLFRVLSILLVVVGAAPELLGVIFTLVGVMGFNLLFDLAFSTTASLQTMLPMTFVARMPPLRCICAGRLTARRPNAARG